MIRGEAPGAQTRASPLSWMEGERGEDRGSGAEAGGRDVAPGGTGDSGATGSDTAPRGPARGAWAPRSAACAPSLCLRLAENRASAAPLPADDSAGPLCRLPARVRRSRPGPGPPRGRNLPGCLWGAAGGV